LVLQGGQAAPALPGAAGAFFTGVLAVVVAAPCTAPFMAAALGAALVLAWPLALAVFLMLGLGLALPYLAAGQMQKHVTLNTALTRLDALLQTAAVSRTTAMQPAEPADGDLYILPAEAEGSDWAGRSEGDLMRFEAGGWTAVPTPPGLVALVLDVPAVWVRGEAGWTPLGAVLGEAQGLERLGLGTTADAANPLSAKLNAALFTARGVAEGGDGDLRLTFNKAGAGDVL
ncbi:DUF2793 domain-containing protein, partial [Lactiplantibacillus plantarum]|nr:DUF2793 domain-containing protein [Lactiplantibacillus plantarum]